MRDRDAEQVQGIYDGVDSGRSDKTAGRAGEREGGAEVGKMEGGDFPWQRAAQILRKTREKNL